MKLIRKVALVAHGPSWRLASHTVEIHDRELQDFSQPHDSVLIDQVVLRSIIQNGSSSQQRKGHISLRHPLLPQPSCVAQDHPRAGRRADLQARKEGRNPLPVRTIAGRRILGWHTNGFGRIGEVLRDSHGIAQVRGKFFEMADTIEHGLIFYSRHWQQDSPNPQVQRYGCLS